MEELILKMHEETLEMQKEISEMSCMISQLADAIHDEEVKRAKNGYMDRKDVEESTLECRTIKRIIGMMPDICQTADEILKKRENGEKEDE